MLGEVGESEEERIRVPAKGEISRSYVRERRGSSRRALRPIHNPNPSEWEVELLRQALDEGKDGGVLGEGRKGVEERCDHVGVERDHDELDSEAS